MPARNTVIFWIQNWYLWSVHIVPRGGKKWFFTFFKGYLRYKMITSQNVSYDVRVKLCFVLTIFKFFYIFNNPMNYQICKSVTSWWVLVHGTHYVTQLGHSLVINKGNNFQESFEQLGGLGQVPGVFQFSNLLQLLNNQLCVKILGFHFFEKVNQGQPKLANVNY